MHARTHTHTHTHIHAIAEVRTSGRDVAYIHFDMIVFEGKAKVSVYAKANNILTPVYNIQPELSHIPELSQDICLSDSSGCVNPVVGLQYPSVTVAKRNETEFSASMNFSWEKPDHLGGLKENELQYRVVLERINSPDSPLEDVIVKKLCYEGTFTTQSEITSVINIKVAALSLHNQSSQDTIIPSTTILGCELCILQSGVCIIYTSLCH